MLETANGNDPHRGRVGRSRPSRPSAPRPARSRCCSRRSPATRWDGETANGMMERSMPRRPGRTSVTATNVTVAAREQRARRPGEAPTPASTTSAATPGARGSRSSSAPRATEAHVQRARRAGVLRLARPAAREPAADRGLVRAATPRSTSRTSRSSCSAWASRAPARPRCRTSSAEDPTFRNLRIVGGADAVPAARRLPRGRRGAHSPARRDGRHRCAAHGGTAAVDAAAVGDRPDGGPRPDGARVQGADLPRRRAHPVVRRLVRSTATWSRRTATRSGC